MKPYALIILILCLGCANTPSGAIDLTPKERWVKEGYILNQNDRNHLYRDNYKELLIKTLGKTVAMYCIEHYRYEKISIIHKPDTIIYIVR